MSEAESMLAKVANLDPIVEPGYYYEGWPFCYYCGAERLEHTTTLHANDCLWLRIRMMLGIATTQEVEPKVSS